MEREDFARPEHEEDSTDEKVVVGWLKHAVLLGLPCRIRRRRVNDAGELAYDCYCSINELAAHFGEMIVVTILAKDETVGIPRRVEQMQFDSAFGLYHVQRAVYPRVFDQHLKVEQTNYAALQCFR